MNVFLAEMSRVLSSERDKPLSRTFTFYVGLGTPHSQSVSFSSRKTPSSFAENRKMQLGSKKYKRADGTEHGTKWLIATQAIAIRIRGTFFTQFFSPTELKVISLKEQPTNWFTGNSYSGKFDSS